MIKKNINVSLIISTYNWPKALKLCLQSVISQTLIPHEIIIADDGSGIETKNLIDKFITDNSDLNIIHVWHEDIGFRLSEIRNRAIIKSISDYIIQIDGDVILNKNYIKDHISFAKPNHYIRGGRAYLNKDLSDKLLNHFVRKFSFLNNGIYVKENGLRSIVLAKLFSKTSRKYNNVIGCNLSFWRDDLISINGYSNDFTGWGFEDYELCSRLINKGVIQTKLKFAGVQFHIHHSVRKRDNQEDRNSLILSNVKNKIVKTKNGLDQLR